MPNIAFHVICVGLFIGSLKSGSGRLTDMNHVNNRILWYQRQLRYIHMIKISDRSSWATFVAGLGWSLMFMSQKQLPGPLLPADGHGVFGPLKGNWVMWSRNPYLTHMVKFDASRYSRVSSRLLLVHCMLVVVLVFICSINRGAL